MAIVVITTARFFFGSLFDLRNFLISTPHYLCVTVHSETRLKIRTKQMKQKGFFEHKTFQRKNRVFCGHCNWSIKS